MGAIGLVLPAAGAAKSARRMPLAPLLDCLVGTDKEPGQDGQRTMRRQSDVSSAARAAWSGSAVSATFG